MREAMNLGHLLTACRAIFAGDKDLRFEPRAAGYHNIHMDF